MKTLSKIQQEVVDKMKEVGYMRVLKVFETCSRQTTIYKVGCLSVRDARQDFLKFLKILINISLRQDLNLQPFHYE